MDTLSGEMLRCFDWFASYSSVIAPTDWIIAFTRHSIWFYTGIVWYYSSQYVHGKGHWCVPTNLSLYCIKKWNSWVADFHNHNQYCCPMLWILPKSISIVPTTHLLNADKFEIFTTTFFQVCIYLSDHIRNIDDNTKYLRGEDTTHPLTKKLINWS